MMRPCFGQKALRSIGKIQVRRTPRNSGDIGLGEGAPMNSVLDPTKTDSIKTDPAKTDPANPDSNNAPAACADGAPVNSVADAPRTDPPNPDVGSNDAQAARPDVAP